MMHETLAKYLCEVVADDPSALLSGKIYHQSRGDTYFHKNRLTTCLSRHSKRITISESTADGIYKLLRAATGIHVNDGCGSTI